MGHSVADTQDELCDLVVEELLEDDIVEEAVEQAINACACEITTEARNRRNQDKAAAAAEAEESKRQEEAARKTQKWIKLPDIVAQTSKFTSSASTYVDNVEHIRQELEKLRAQRDEIVHGIETLSHQMTCAKERVDAAKEDLREGERDLDRARLDVFLQLQHFGEDCVYIDSDPRKPLPHQALLSSVTEDAEEDEEGQREAQAEEIARGLTGRNFVSVDGFAPPPEACRVLAELVSLRQQEMLRPGLVGGGRGDEEKCRRKVALHLCSFLHLSLAIQLRGMISYYADFQTQGQRRALLDQLGPGGGGGEEHGREEGSGGDVLEGKRVELSAVDRVVQRMDVAVAMAARRAMLTCYPGQGAAYVRHVDNPNGNGRVLTAILYLNADFNPATDGGQIRLFVRDGTEAGREEAIDIDPLLNRLLLFWSDKRVPHQVLPCHRERYAVTVWYSDAAAMSGMVR